MRSIRFILCGVLSLVTTGRSAAKTSPGTPVVVYDGITQVSTSMGYRDNILLSSITQESSLFFQTVLDTSLLRMSESGAFLMLYLLAEDTRYFNAPSVNYEQLISASAQYTTPVGDRDKIGLQTDYLYLHQIFDASETETDLRSILAEGHSITLRPHWEHTFGGGWTAQLEAEALRQTYKEELDDYSEGSGQMSLMYSYGNRSEASIDWQHSARTYDTREQYDRAGLPVANTELHFRQNLFVTRWRHNWDKKRHWQTTTRFSYLFNRDNGSGYFDYDRQLLRQQVRWTQNDWSINANVDFGQYLYSTQKIGDDRRERSYTAVDMLVERQLGEHWRIQLAAEHEWNHSNDPLDTFRTWTASTGITYEF